MNHAPLVTLLSKFMRQKLNKNRQFAPTGPDAKTAARFWRRCGRRYV